MTYPKIIHTVEALKDGVQRCVHCKRIITDYRNSFTNPGGPALRGYPAGPVMRWGNMTGTAIDDDAVPCTPLN